MILTPNTATLSLTVARRLSIPLSGSNGSRSCENGIVLSIVENVGNANPDIFATHD